MGALKQLLDQYCPDGVDYVRMGDVVKIRNGKDWKEQEAGTVAVYGSGGKMSVTVSSAASHGPSVLLPRKGSLDVQFVEGPFWNIDTVFRTETNEDKLSPKFFYYAALGLDLESISSSSTRPSLTQTALNNLEIPLPPRAVQDKIVEYIDTFAAMCDNLDLEVEQRERQLEALRFQLLQRFAVSHVDRAPLGDVVKITNGRDWKDQEPGEVPVYGSGGLMDARVAAPAGVGPAVLLPRKGSLDVQYVDGPFWNIDTVFRTSVDETVLLPKFFYYAASELDLESISTSSTRPSLTQKALNKLVVPLPPLSVQQEISDKLDTMQELIDNLKHERELRGRQFEYYRSRLLDFAAKESETND